jgi:TetR/AcrR family transcriptional regulator, regulator of cefoperazone and chloramphenicol sensitivity
MNETSPVASSVTRSPEDDTRARMIQAAGEVFADHGFEGAKVRTITERAGVNVAAVNYHFRDKAELYKLVLLDACSIKAAYRETLANAADAPEEQLRFLIRRFMSDLLDPDRPNWKRRLLAREMSMPTAALDNLVAQNIRPFRDEFLSPVLRQFLGPEATERQVRLTAGSIMGQCLYYLMSRPILERLNPDFKLGPTEVNEISDHITNFTLGALRTQLHIKHQGNLQ